MSPGFGSQSSRSGLLSPWITKPSSAEPPMIRWMTMIPAPKSCSGTRYATMSPFAYELALCVMIRSPVL
jgi:hypothetical protein